MMVFVFGFVVVECLEVHRQGLLLHYSKWWNVVDFFIILTFVAAYVLWMVAWGAYDKQWKPRSRAFIAADILYASASVLAYFHLAHVFQVNSTLGPLQLSLYKMLKYVLKLLTSFCFTSRFSLVRQRYTRTTLQHRTSCEARMRLSMISHIRSRSKLT